MTKEQEKAIRYVNFMSKTIKFDKSGFPYGKESLETVLNMLKEKDAELKKYKKKNKEISNQILILYKEQDDYNARIDKKNTELKKKDEELEMYKDIKEIVNSKVTDLVKLKQYDNLKKKVDKQDKMIDLILNEQIEDGYLVNFNNLEEAKKYYEDKYERKL